MTMCKLFAVVIYALVYIKKIKKTRKHIKIFKYNSKQFSSFDFLEWLISVPEGKGRKSLYSSDRK